MIKGKIHSFETFGSADGPGVRFIVFLQGCHFRCLYCHNPDTWALNSEQMIEMTAEELINKIIKYKNYWGKEGGITISGGEPLLQIDFLIELFTLAKEKGIHTCIDTAGQPFKRSDDYLEKFDQLMELTDLVMLDIKHIDSAKHKVITSFENSNILQMLDYLDEIKKDTWIRYVLVTGYSDNLNDIKQLRKLLDTKSNIKKVEVLPYHAYGEHKYEFMNLEYRLKGMKPPVKEVIDQVKEILEK